MFDDGFVVVDGLFLKCWLRCLVFVGFELLLYEALCIFVSLLWFWGGI